MSVLTNEKPVLFIDGERIYKFRIGDVVKISNNYYRLENIQPLRHGPVALGSIATTETGTFDFSVANSQYMQPLEGYLYWVEKVAIDGRCGFRFEFPKGQPHLHPKGSAPGEYIYFRHAKPSDPLYLPFVIEPPYYPTWQLYNPHTAANNSDAWFWGFKWQVEMLKGMDVPSEGYIELTDYRRSGELGTA